MFSDITDLPSRTFTNDFFINSFYFLWTSFWYIPMFILTLVFIFATQSGTLSRPSMIIMSLILLVSLSHIYQSLVPHNYLNDYLGENFNILLSNSINKFHPALFYLTLLLGVLYQPTSKFNTNRLYTSINSRGLYNYYTLITVPVIIFTLSLGSWWALQEGSWGGWWNWDPSEVFGLLVMLVHLNSVHRKTATAHQLAWLSIFFTYTFIQLNFDLVSHNFGTRVDQFIDSSHNFLLLLLLIFTLLLLAYLNYNTHWSNSIISYRFKVCGYLLNWGYLLYLWVVVVVLSSFTLLLNDFFWKILQINIFNTTNITHYFTIFTIVLLTARTWSVSIFMPILLTTLTITAQGGLIYGFLVHPNIISTFHTSLLVTLHAMSSELNQSVSSWFFLGENSSVTKGFGTSDSFSTAITLNNFFIEYVTPQLVNNTVSELFWNMLWSSSSTENHSFVHPISTYSLAQELYSGTDISPYCISVADTSIVSTALIFTLTLPSLFSLIQNRTRIIW